MAVPLEDKPNPHDAQAKPEEWAAFNGRAYVQWQDSILHDWGRYKEKVTGHFAFDDAQTEQAGKVFAYYEGQLKSHLEDVREDLEEYRHELFRLAQRESTPSADEVPFEGQRNSTTKAETYAQAATLKAGVEAIEQEYQRELEGLATAEQLEKLGNTPAESSALAAFDTFLIYTHFLIGACLVVGLLTRLAAFGAGTFLLLVVLSRPPWDVGYQIVGYQIVMMFASFLLMATAAGRWAGLDYFIHLWRSGKCCSTTSTQGDA
jgi:uncharacterized membrane protein YphA (DoxX/SURF4 family)